MTVTTRRFSLNRLWGTNTTATRDVMPEDVMSFWRTLWQAIQQLLTASGANIVGPILMHLDPSMAVFTSGIATLIYTRFARIPAYLGTSFSYIPPIATIMVGGAANLPIVGGGIIAAGVATSLVGIVVYFVGWRWITILMPPAVLAMVVITIGLLLGPVAWGEATSNPLLAVITFGLGVLFAARTKKGTLFNMLPVLLSIAIGYILALVLGEVDLSAVQAAPWVKLPTLIVPAFDIKFMAQMALIAVTAVLMEHLGHLQATGTIVGRPYLEKSARSLFVDGIADAVSWSGTPSTTYAENIAVYSLNHIFSLRMMYVAGFLAVLAGFIGKLSPLILSIPAGVLGGATFLLFGMIAWAGFNLFQQEHVDLSKQSNQVLVASMSTMMITGIVIEWLRTQTIPVDATGLQTFASSLNLGSFPVPGVVAVAVVGIVLNMVLNWREIMVQVHTPTPATDTQK